MSSSPDFTPLLPRAGHARAWWRAPGTRSGLAWAVAQAARAHEAPILLVAADNQQAHQFEADLRTLLGDTPDLPQGEKLQQLERGSRQLRRSRVKDGGDPSGAAPTQDW